MHMLAFLYPSAPGHRFDADHWRKVHLPLGLGLTDKYLGVRPRRILLLSPGQAADLSFDAAPHQAVAIVIFDTREEVERFSTLFEFEEAARRLSADFPNYTAGPPSVLVSALTEVNDVDAMIEVFQASEAGAG